MTILLALVGLGLLVLGGEALVRGASRLALRLGISPLVIGLTVVAFGTSSPEMAVSVGAGLSGGADLAIGNVVGSNIFNVLFILGLSALVTPLRVSQQLVRIDAPLMVIASVLAFVLAMDGRIGRLDGTVLFGGVVVYTVFAIRQSRRESRAVQAEYEQEFGGAGVPAKRIPAAPNLALIAVGLLLLVVGSRWLVAGAVALARGLGVSEFIVGVTIVAAGTSLPEVAASVVAAVKGERDIAVGNVVGSNLFNLLAVLGATAVVSPDGIGVAAAALRFDFPVMIAVALACLPIFVTGWCIERWEGLVFLAYYVAYTGYLILDASDHDALPAFSATMLWFAGPLTIVTLLVMAWRGYRAGPTSVPSR
jgi:cation:H+ antiporter